MKKISFAVALIGLLTFTGAVQAAEEETASSWESEAKVTFEGNDGTVTPPVDPTDPDIQPPPIDPVDPTNPGTGNEGPLSIDMVSNLNFESVKIKGTVATYYAKNTNPYVQVTDKRGVVDGWRLTAQMSSFHTEDGSELKGAELSLLNGVLRTQSTNQSEPPIGNDTIKFTPDTGSIAIMTAATDTGRGTWVDVFEGTNDVQLKVLGGSALAKSYSAELNWELATTPE